MLLKKALAKAVKLQSQRLRAIYSLSDWPDFYFRVVLFPLFPFIRS